MKKNNISLSCYYKALKYVYLCILLTKAFGILKLPCQPNRITSLKSNSYRLIIYCINISSRKFKHGITTLEIQPNLVVVQKILIYLVQNTILKFLEPKVSVHSSQKCVNLHFAYLVHYVQPSNGVLDLSDFQTNLPKMGCSIF